MMRALFAGVTGLRSHQTKMDVIGNNIANVNTLGFKKSAANFADLYSQTTASASAPTGDKGGTNASQIGLGVACNAIVVKHTPGAPSYTGNTLDLAIAGDGYFTVRTGANGELAYTRAGNFSTSSNGTLVTSAGHFVQCYNAMYQTGTAGTISATAGVTNNSANGFNSYNFDANDGAIQSAASGVYTMRLDDNYNVEIYKNGVLFETQKIQVKDENGEFVDMPARFDPNAQYQIQTSLGVISFKADGHSLTASGLKDKTYQNLLQCNFEQTDQSKLLNSYLPVGTYSIGVSTTTGANGVITAPLASLPKDLNWSLPEGATAVGDGAQLKLGTVIQDRTENEAGTEVVTRGIEYRLVVENQKDPNKPEDPDNFVAVLMEVPFTNTETIDPAAGGNTAPSGPSDISSSANTVYNEDARTASTFTLRDVEGNEVKKDVLDSNQTYYVETPLGNIKFTTKAGSNIPNPLGKDNSDTSWAELVDSVRFTVTAPNTEGTGTAYTTAMAQINSLLQQSTITISNNDGFSSGGIVGDMVISPDLFENVMVNESGAVIAQLKKDTTADDLRKLGIVGATDMGAGETVVLGYVAMASFANAEGLEKIGTNLYQSTTNSGAAMYGLAGSAGIGSLSTSSLEMSNVDLSEEMVNMITTQRGFQANSRIITVTDTMLEELINLKR